MRYLRLLFLFFILSESAYAGEYKLGIRNYSQPLQRFEDSEGGIFWDNVRFGGNIGLQFGNPTNILLSPSMAYVPQSDFLDNKLMIGIGITYLYSRVKYADINYSSNVYGGRLFGRYLIIDNIFAHTEFESLNAPNYVKISNNRTWVNSFFVGGGYQQSIGNRSGFSITVLYNLAWTPTNIIYSSPWNIRFGVMF
jgi:hypothetical protein